MADGSLMKVEHNAPIGAFCNTFDLRLAIVGLLKTTISGLPFEWQLKIGFTTFYEDVMV